MAVAHAVAFVHEIQVGVDLQDVERALSVEGADAGDVDRVVTTDGDGQGLGGQRLEVPASVGVLERHGADGAHEAGGTGHVIPSAINGLWFS